MVPQIELGIFLILSHFTSIVLTAQPRIIEMKTDYPEFTPEKSVQGKIELKWDKTFYKLEQDFIKPRLDNCPTRLAQKSELVKKINFISYRFRSQWPTPNSPVSDYTTQFPTYLFSFQVNDREFWHLKVIDLDRCCGVNETQNFNETDFTNGQIVGLLGSKSRHWDLEDFKGNDCPLLKLVKKRKGPRD